MGPVNDATLGIRFKFAIEFDCIADLQAGNSGCEVDVVGDQKRLS